MLVSHISWAVRRLGTEGCTDRGTATLLLDHIIKKAVSDTSGRKVADWEFPEVHRGPGLNRGVAIQTDGWSASEV